jgi:Na+/proline symporter
MLTTVDYCVLVVLLLASILIGIYYGFFAKQKQNSISEYLFGSKNLSVWPVALSLTAT